VFVQIVLKLSELYLCGEKKILDILFIDDNHQLFQVLKDNFSFVGHYLFYAKNTQNAFSVLEKEDIDIILLDVKLGNENGVETLEKLKEIYPCIPVIMITGYATVEAAVRAIKLGAFDFVSKPIDFNTLCTIIDSATEHKMEQKAQEGVSYDLNGAPILLQSKNAEYCNVLHRAKQLAASDITILIIGENGTGKEGLAEYIYKNSNRRAENFIKINCAAFPESLLDNELFGHEKGAYTGASSEYRGVFEQADGGTLLLDEIGDMPKTLQAKILRVLQNQEIRRIGGNETRKISVRFLASTNKDLPTMVQEGMFREDLFYRLNGGMLQIPPLRKRKEDIEDLIHHLLNRITDNTSLPHKRLSPEVLSVFIGYSWPGNIRELKNALLYAVTISQSEELMLEDLPPGIEVSGSLMHNSLSLVQQKEKELIQNVLRKTNNNKSEAAKYLNMGRNTLYLKLKKYGLV